MTPKSMDVVLFAFDGSPKAVEEIAARGSYTIRRAPRRGGRSPGDPHLSAQWLVVYQYGNRDEFVALESVLRVTGPVEERYEGLRPTHWELPIAPTSLRAENLELLVDPRADINLRGETLVGIIR